MNKLFKGFYVYRELHAILFEPICKKYGVTITEIQVLLFLNEHEHNNTAKDIGGSLKITKSYVSSAVHDLMRRGYIEGCHEGNDMRSVHLHLRDEAKEIIKESLEVKKRFMRVLLENFSEEEKANLKNSVEKMMGNIECFLKEYSANKNK